MNIDKFIKWDEVWNEEICLQTSINCLSNNDINLKTIGIIEQFEGDKCVELIASECQVNDNNLIFCFSETGGQSEGDAQGWSRDYTFIVDSDFLIIGAEYSQG